jgi:hypothetical protein
VAAAFGPALGEIARQLDGWALASGEQHEHGVH